LRVATQIHKRLVHHDQRLVISSSTGSHTIEAILFMASRLDLGLPISGTACIPRAELAEQPSFPPSAPWRHRPCFAKPS
jgi:hypothetical protein